MDLYHWLIVNPSILLIYILIGGGAFAAMLIRLSGPCPPGYAAPVIKGILCLCFGATWFIWAILFGSRNLFILLLEGPK